MSKYTDFFPLAGGGGGGSSEITDPTKLPLIMAQTKTSNGENPNNGFFSLYKVGDQDIDNVNVLPAIATPILTQLTSYNACNAIVQVTDGVESTILNITGSGYLCNVASAVAQASATAGVDCTITITIIVDGTTYTFSADPHTNSVTSGYETRLLWGFHSKGNSVSNSGRGNTPYEGSTGYGTPGILGFSNDLLVHNSSSLPPANRPDNRSNSNVYNLRVFGAPEFKNLNFPKLRFENSLVIKTQTNNLYTASTSWTRAGASYYLDSFVM